MKILYLDEARMHTLSAGPKHLLRLNPGRNQVDDETYDAVLNAKGKKETQSALEKMIEKGTITVAGDTLDITKMNVREALSFVEKEATEEGLIDLFNQESESKKPRKTVMDAIEGLLDKIQNAPKVADEDVNVDD